jgi:hypothetical protein
MERHHEHPQHGRNVGESLSHPKADADVEADHRQDNHQYDYTSQRKSGEPKRSPPLVLAHAQRQEDHGAWEAKEPYVADNVVDGADGRSFCADIYREDPCQQYGDSVETK